MADISRQSSPRIASTLISSSPSRPSPLSRPHWPYTTYTHRPSSSASSSNSLSSSVNSTSSIGVQGWDYRSAGSGAGTPSPSGIVRRPSSASLPNGAAVMEDGMRHWSFAAFEWIVRDVHRLRDHVELTEQSGNSDAHNFDILKESPVLYDGKFKLEIAKPPPPEATEASTIKTQSTALSLYITSVILEFAHTDYEITSSMFAGIKCQDDRAGERGARPEWAWEFWQNEWTFREDSEVWECPLPPLSVLLENPRINDTDSFVICVQMHCPVGPFYPHQPSASFVPKDLLDGLEALLDNANTGDIQFICLERKEDTQLSESVPSSPGTETPQSHRPVSPASTTASTVQPLVRKRVIYAHSDILTRRSEYFATMLSSSFSENVTAPKTAAERKLYTIVVEEADFVTIYWLLKWVYANWLLFKEHDNPKAAVEGVGAGLSARSIEPSSLSDEWAWTTLSKGEPNLDALEVLSGPSDTRSVTSAEGSGSKGKRPAGQSQASPPSRTPSSSVSRASPSLKSTPSSNPVLTSRTPSSPPRRSASGTSSAGSSSNLTVPSSPSKSSAASRRDNIVTIPPPISTSSLGFTPNPTYPLSPLKQRQRPRAAGSAVADPHPHPTPAPPPASALSMYQVAHRYSMPGLASLSLEHMLSTVTPQSSFALLLAASTWDELHALVEDYVVDKWEEVSGSAEFEQCCQEVAAGEWGPEGGKTLMGLFRRLRSPVVSNRP